MTFNKTVLQIVPELNSGGAERSTLEIAQAIVAAGGRALVASKGGRLEPDIAAAGAEFVALPVNSKNPATIWANAGRLARLVEREQVDILHVRSRAPAWSALWAARRTGRPLVSTYHGAYEAKDPFKRLYNSAMVRADRVIANSQFTAASVRAQYDFKAEKLRVIPRGADLAMFDPAEVTAQRVAALGWDRPNGASAAEPVFKLLLPARLTFWKGQDIAIRALAGFLGRKSGSWSGVKAATGQREGLRLILAGDVQGSGDFVRGLRREVEDYGVRDMVEFVGHCADMPAAYSWADAVLSPATLPEAFGRVVAEAGAMGRPVIASDLGGQRETVIDGVTGVLTPPGDVEAVADAIWELEAMGAGGRAAMGSKARTHIAENFSADAMRKATLNVYAELVG